jgi:caffeoyl-CoA O-methyltransferase
MDFIAEEIEDYAIEHTTEESDLLYELNRTTHLEVLQPRMLSGHLQGRMLSMISKMLRPHRILEIGTYTGYSALCMAEGLSENGKLVTIDVNYELKERIQSFFDRSVYVTQLDLRIGNALEIVPELDEEWDLVFIDADKHNYANYFDLVIDKVKKGGVIIADNVLWSGKVLEQPNANDVDTAALIAFNKKIQADKRVENLLLPFRDGLMIIRKL